MKTPGIQRCRLVVPAVYAILVAQFASGCSNNAPGAASQSYKGVINLEGVRLGIPEEGAKSAILSFVRDPNVAAPNSQYLSRTYDKSGGQYCLSYTDGLPRQVRVVYSQKPISKAEALEKLKTILPASVPEETKVDDSEVKAGKKDAPVETHYYGDNLKTELIYADKSGSLVKVLSVYNLPKNANNEIGKDASDAAGSAKKEAAAK